MQLPELCGLHKPKVDFLLSLYLSWASGDILLVNVLIEELQPEGGSSFLLPWLLRQKKEGTINLAQALKVST